MIGSFEVDGAPLRQSILSRRINRAASCRFLLDIRPETLDGSLELLAQHGSHGDLFSGLSIRGVADLEFLRAYPGLLYLEIEDVPAKALQCIEAVSNLRGLRVQSPKCGIDFGCFPELEEFVGDWHRDNSGIARCRELRTLRTLCERAMIQQGQPGTRRLMSRLSILATAAPMFVARVAAVAATIVSVSGCATYKIEMTDDYQPASVDSNAELFITRINENPEGKHCFEPMMYVLTLGIIPTHCVERFNVSNSDPSKQDESTYQTHFKVTSMQGWIALPMSLSSRWRIGYIEDASVQIEQRIRQEVN